MVYRISKRLTPAHMRHCPPGSPPYKLVMDDDGVVRLYANGVVIYAKP
jgi:hypothetical protein